MSPTAAQLVRDALASLAARAGVLDADPPEVAAGKVLAVLRADEVRGRRCQPDACVLWEWLRVESGVPFARVGDPGWRDRPRLLLSTGHAIVVERAAGVPGAVRAVLAMPAGVAAAVRVADGVGGAPDLERRDVA